MAFLVEASVDPAQAKVQPGERQSGDADCLSATNIGKAKVADGADSVSLLMVGADVWFNRRGSRGAHSQPSTNGRLSPKQSAGVAYIERQVSVAADIRH